MKDEPSVLDYVKWLFSLKWDRPLEIPSDIPELENEQEAESLDFLEPPREKISLVERFRRFNTAVPWRTAIAFFFGIMAQVALEPPRPYEHPSFLVLFLYFDAAFFAVWGMISKEWQPAENELDQLDQPLETWVRWLPLLVGLVTIPLLIVAFRGNEFTDINVFLWVLCFLFILSAFWKTSGQKLLTQLRAGWSRLNQLERNPLAINLKITPFFLLLVAVIGLALFFRFYRLDEVPAEMWSDHAEKLLDVNDVLNGDHNIFFIRNTGREAFQFYLTALIIQVSGLDIGFLALKLGTVLSGVVTLFYMYRLGKLVANRWVGLGVLLLAGVAYWPNLVSRVALRYALYPLFVAPLLFYLIRGIRSSNRNDMIKAGIALGIGLHGYSTYRIVPFLVVLAFILYWIHAQSKNKRRQSMGGLVILALISLIIFMPLLSFSLENPEAYGQRAFSRLIPDGETQKSLIQVFVENTWRAGIMFFWDNGEIWVHSIPHRPALDPVTAVLFFLGGVLLVVRYLRQRDWLDLFLLLSIPVLLLPSILSLAFPNENPSLNRAAGAYVPVFLIAAIGLEALARAWFTHAKRLRTKSLVAILLLGLSVSVASSNYALVFDKFDQQFRGGAWNTREMGELIRQFSNSTGSRDTAYVVAYPYWVDTRLVGINAGDPEKDYAIWPENFDLTISDPRAKLFIIKAEDVASLEKLRQMYPSASYWLHQVPDLVGKDYYIFLVPSAPGDTTGNLRLPIDD